MGWLFYIVATAISLASGILLLRGFSRGQHRLLFWSGLCFLGLAASNLLVFVDLILLRNIDLYPLRLMTAALSMLVLLYGLIWEGE